MTVMGYCIVCGAPFEKNVGRKLCGSEECKKTRFQRQHIESRERNTAPISSLDHKLHDHGVFYADQLKKSEANNKRIVAQYGVRRPA